MFIVSSRVGWVIIGDPGSEKMVGGMSTFSTRSRQAVCQQSNGEDETWCWRIGKSVKVKMTVWSQVREGIGSCLGVYTALRAAVGHMTWRRVPATGHGG